MPTPPATVMLTIAVCLGLLLVAACKEEASAPAPPPAGEFTGVLECRLRAAVAEPLPECVSWSYDPDTGTLEVLHENACLNCCPESAPRVAWEDGALVLVEDEAGHGCHCLCLYDLAYKVEGVAPAALTLVARCDCLRPEEECLQGVLDLAAATTGTICLERDHYPWR